MITNHEYFRAFSTNVIEPAFRDLSFGEDVRQVEIFFILFKTRPGFEKWEQPKRPRFTESFVGKDGRVIFDKHFSIDIRFDGDLFDEFLKADEAEAYRIIARESYKALDLLSCMPKRLKKFDKEAFRAAVKDLYEKKGLM